MKKTVNNADHITKQLAANKEVKRRKAQTDISKSTHECVYGADNKPITSVYHGF